MKTLIKLSFLFSLLLFIQGTDYSIDTASVRLFPMQTGNVYVYIRSGNGGGNGLYRSEITKDTVINSHKYYYFTGFPYINQRWVRVDSITGSFMMYETASPCSMYYQERIVDSLSSRIIGNASNSCNTGVYLSDTNITNIFGQNRKTKYFGIPGFHTATFYRYAKDIGMTYYQYYFYQPYGYYAYDLRGAVINGVYYGDTSGVTAITQNNSEIPNNFSLFQNYPNPFNPTTKIKFDIPKQSFAKLIVYDVNGRQVAELVNEELKPGIYSFDWDGSGYASGIYFYKLETGGYVETKKMLMIK